MGLINSFFSARIVLIANTCMCKCAATKWHSSKGSGSPIALNTAVGFQLFEVTLHGR